MTEMFVLKAKNRDILGTGSSRSLRAEGWVPANVYGNGHKNLSIAVEEKEITKLYRTHGFTSKVIGVEIDGKIHKVLPKAVQLHPITDLVNHVDLVFLDKKYQKVDVPVVFDGKERSVGVKRGGFFNIIMRKLPLLCPVDSIPLDIKIDVSNMGIGASIIANKLKLPEGCSLSTKKTKLIVASITGRGGKSDTSTGTEA